MSVNYPTGATGHPAPNRFLHPGLLPRGPSFLPDVFNRSPRCRIEPHVAALKLVPQDLLRDEGPLPLLAGLQASPEAALPPPGLHSSHISL